MLAFNPIRALLLSCTVLAMNAGGQLIHTRAPSQSSQRTIARENWQMQGRKIRGMNSAILRQRALQQKLQMRAATANALSFSAGWTLLGPLPLPSDASGIGLQDYGFVSGRATAVAIDPNDLSGNTVFVGGAYAGVWKSTNAGALSTNPALVNWLPLTDNQATLAIGAIAIQPQLSNPNANSSVVLAGTGETNSSADSYYGGNSAIERWWTVLDANLTGRERYAFLRRARL